MPPVRDAGFCPASEAVAATGAPKPPCAGVSDHARGPGQRVTGPRATGKKCGLCRLVAARDDGGTGMMRLSGNCTRH